ncbi:MAG TPA: ATP-binding protein, partial [Oscillatoriaceae cyanobacterium]
LNAVLFFDTDMKTPWLPPSAPPAFTKFDLAHSPQAGVAKEALRTGHIVASDPVRLPDGRQGFWLFTPVSLNGHVVGLAGMANDLDPMLDFFRQVMSEAHNALHLTDSRGHVFFGEVHLPARTHQLDLTVADRRWQFTIAEPIAPLFRYLPALFAGLAGLVLWAAAIAFIWGDLFQSDRLSREVEARTAELQGSRDQLRAILDGVDAGIVAIGLDGNVVYANQAGRAQLLSYDGKLEGMTARGRYTYFTLRDAEGHVLVPEERPSARALRGETVRGEVLTLEVPGAEPVQMLFKATPIHMADTIPLAIVISQNVTERVKLEKALRDQLKAREALDRMKSDFLSVVTHELRTPLTSIKGYSEFLEDGIAGDLTDQQMSYVHQVQTATQQLEALVDDLLDMARMEAGEFTLRRQTVDAAAIAGQALEGFQPQAAIHRIRLRLESPPRLEMWADPVRLTQILNNLLSNAMKFTPDGGEVALLVRDNGPETEFVVCDTGIGIAPENLPRLFTKFFQVEKAHTRAHKGTGLGLAITKGLVEMHGGRVSAESTLGEGTSIRVCLPKDGNRAA